MTLPDFAPDPLADLPDTTSTPAHPSPTTNITVTSRLKAAMDNPAAVLRGEEITVAKSEDTFQPFKGVDNPYGTGIRAYEPNTEIFQDYQTAYGKVQESKEADAAKAAQDTITLAPSVAPAAADFASGGNIQADGKVSTMVQAALNLAARRVPYVWGGTTANGVDCSGLLYYAARAAGIDTKRWRATDYGHMGTAVTMDQARPGDVIYYDENGPGNTDHVGLYIGNGKMVVAPQTGDVVKVQTVYGHPTSIRRIFNDSAFATIAQPTGGPTYNYGNSYYNPGAAQVGTNNIVRTVGVGRSRAI